jgi:hypothetical protein
LNNLYVASVSDISKDEFLKAIDFVPPKIKSDLMTTYSRIKEEGKIEGKIEGKTEVILNGFESGLDIKLLANITNMPEHQVLAILKEHKKVD